jgi:dihydrofolate reductase
MTGNADSRVTIHMAASLDGFIARKDGSVDWLETSDEFAGGDTMDPALVEAFLKSIDCYVMGSRTYETALNFEAKGLGWLYGDKPVFVLTSRKLPQARATVEFHSGDLSQFVKGRLRPAFRSIWFVGGGVVSGECLRLGLADEVRYSILPVLIGEGISFFEKLGRDVALHLAEMKAYKSGMVALCYEVRGGPGEQPVQPPSKSLHPRPESGGGSASNEPPVPTSPPVTPPAGAGGAPSLPTDP